MFLVNVTVYHNATKLSTWTSKIVIFLLECIWQIYVYIYVSNWIANYLEVQAFSKSNHGCDKSISLQLYIVLYLSYIHMASEVERVKIIKL